MRERDNITRTGAQDPWGREGKPLAQRLAEARRSLDTEPDQHSMAEAGEGQRKLRRDMGMRGTRLTVERCRKALSDMLALKPYWGKPTVRNFRGDDGNVGIIRSPIRAIVLLDHFVVTTCRGGRWLRTGQGRPGNVCGAILTCKRVVQRETCRVALHNCIER